MSNALAAAVIGRLRPSPRKLFRWGIAALVVIVMSVVGFYYWHRSQLFVSTDDAYVNAHTVQIGSQVSGPVTKVYVRDNQPVKAGDPLFDIDPRPYEVALSKAQAQLELARQNSSQQSASVASAEAQLAQRRAELTMAKSNDQRNQQLVASGFLSKQGAETARSQVETAQAAVQGAVANVLQAQSALGKSGNENAGVKAARAAADQATLDLEHTHVIAPTNGVIANLTLRPGSMVTPGAPLFALIGDREYWVDANFKETEIKRIREGQPATISVDMYPDHPFNGVVESLSGGSGNAFSLLPPQNATGNWVKVTQRVPVRVRVVDVDPTRPLRIGTTATVDVKVAD